MIFRRSEIERLSVFLHCRRIVLLHLINVAHSHTNVCCLLFIHCDHQFFVVRQSRVVIPRQCENPTQVRPDDDLKLRVDKLLLIVRIVMFPQLHVHVHRLLQPCDRHCKIT